MKSPASKGLSIRRLLPQVLAVVLVLPSRVGGQQPAPPEQTKPIAPLPTVRSLKVIPLAGNNEMNDLERRVMAPLVVQVLDQNDKPIEGADVTFRFPLNGPSAVFPDHTNSQTVRTNADGQAAAVGWMANSEVGTFQVRVTASRGNEIGETSISMTNVTRIVGVEGRGKHKSWWSSRWAKIGIIAGAAAVVTVTILATRGGTSTTTSTPTITAHPGSPTIGGPP